jgi:hypothetical protein
MSHGPILCNPTQADTGDSRESPVSADQRLEWVRWDCVTGKELATSEKRQEKNPASQRLAGFLAWWAVQGSNLRPLPCEGSALPLS